MYEKLQGRVQIGIVGVDSGQLMVCDPCYIDSQWENKEFKDIRRYLHVDGTILEYRADFDSYEQILPQYGKTMNQLIEGKEVTKIERESDSCFSYNGISTQTLSNNSFGQLNYKLGHPGVAVAFSSGYGDGTYPVYAEKNEDGRVLRVVIEMSDDLPPDPVEDFMALLKRHPEDAPAYVNHDIAGEWARSILEN